MLGDSMGDAGDARDAQGRRGMLGHRMRECWGAWVRTGDAGVMTGGEEDRDTDSLGEVWGDVGGMMEGLPGSPGHVGGMPGR